VLLTHSTYLTAYAEAQRTLHAEFCSGPGVRTQAVTRRRSVKAGGKLPLLTHLTSHSLSASGPSPTSDGPRTPKSPHIVIPTRDLRPHASCGVVVGVPQDEAEWMKMNQMAYLLSSPSGIPHITCLLNKASSIVQPDNG